MQRTGCLGVLAATLLVSLAAQSAASDDVEVRIRDAAFRFPRSYDVQGSTLPGSGELGTFWLRAPVDVLPILPKAGPWKTVGVTLTLHFESYEAARKRALDAFEATIKHERNESGMTVYSKREEKFGFWSSDILVPAENPESAYFICPRPYRNGKGEFVHVLCEANVEFEPDRRPIVVLSYHLRRDHLASWRDIDRRVREFLDRHRVR